ncbi:MAG: alpha/beta hydrolase [Clostridia bacterium]|nr:alpha/beta hydrolase [Clostridia bacterium]
MGKTTKYHVAYANDFSASKAEKKAFKKEFHMPRYAFMAHVFELFEEPVAEGNSRTPWDADVKIDKDVVYKTVNGEDLVMDIYYPPFPIDGKAPLVMVIPGGGWVIHNRFRRDGYARNFAALGAVVAVIDHRLGPTVFFPENLHDCIDAYNFLVDNADKYNFDINNITVTGDSSGGHMTACLGCAASSEDYVKKLEIPAPKVKPQNCIMVSGAFSMEVMYKIPCTHKLMVRYTTGVKSRKAFRAWKYYKEIDPYNYLNPDFPESYNNGGNIDLLCLGEAKRMGEKMTAAGIKNEYWVGKGFHDYVMNFPQKASRKDMYKLYSWYVEKNKERGVDLSEGWKRVSYFLENYDKALEEAKR